MTELTSQQKQKRRESQQRYALRKKGFDVPFLERGTTSIKGYIKKLFRCEICENDFIRNDRPDTDPKKSKLNFCSSSCYFSYAKGIKNPNFKGLCPCKKCGIHVMGAQRKFCSKDCYTSYYKEVAINRAPQDRLNRNMKTSITRHLSKGIKARRSWRSLVGFGSQELRDNIESKFKNGMTWQNYGSYWHLDHIRPIVSFCFSSPEDSDFKECWSLSNLQPLTVKENLEKGSKYNGKRYYRN